MQIKCADASQSMMLHRVSVCTLLKVGKCLMMAMAPRAAGETSKQLGCPGDRPDVLQKACCHSGIAACTCSSTDPWPDSCKMESPTEKADYHNTTPFPTYSHMMTVTATRWTHWYHSSMGQHRYWFGTTLVPVRASCSRKLSPTAFL